MACCLVDAEVLLLTLLDSASELWLDHSFTVTRNNYDEYRVSDVLFFSAREKKREFAGDISTVGWVQISPGPLLHSPIPLVVLTFLNSFTPSAEFVDNLPHGDVESSTGG